MGAGTTHHPQPLPFQAPSEAAKNRAPEGRGLRGALVYGKQGECGSHAPGAGGAELGEGHVSFGERGLGVGAAAP